MIDVRQTKEHAGYLRRIGWITIKAPSGAYVFIKKFPIVGLSIIKVQRVLLSQVDFNWLKKLAKKYRALILYIEPLDAAVPGFKIDRSPMLASKTLVVSLRKTEKQLLSQMKPKTRYNIGLSSRKGLIVRAISGSAFLADTTLFNSYYTLMEENSKRLHRFEMPKNWLFSQIDAFGDACFVVCVYSEKTLIAAALFLCSNDCVFYSHNGSGVLGRSVFAPTLVVWEGMREGKRRRLSWFDFEGIYDERHPLKRWQGFSRFKHGFGGDEILFPPVYYCLFPGLTMSGSMA